MTEERAPRYTDLFVRRHPEGSEGTDCTYCPICTAIGVVRKSRPELVEHLGSAAREVLLAAGLLLEDVAERLGQPDQPEHLHDGNNVRRIDTG